MRVVHTSESLTTPDRIEGAMLLSWSSRAGEGGRGAAQTADVLRARACVTAAAPPPQEHHTHTHARTRARMLARLGYSGHSNE